MKIKMKGSELKKVDIEFLSLVKRGANRAPFKVVKAEDGGVAAEKTGLIGAVQKFFAMAEPAPAVVAVFVEKSALSRSLPNLADAGFSLNSYDLQDDCVVFKQEGFEDAEQVVMLKSEATVGFAVANVGGYADLFSGRLDFDPSVAATGFYPGKNEAMKALQIAMNVEKSDTSETLRSFAAYTAQLTKAIPESVWKFESLQRGFGGDTNGSIVDGEGGSVKVLSELAKAATELAGTIAKAMNGGKEGGAQDQAQAQTNSTTSESDENSSTSELAGSSDDSTDDEAAKKAKMAKGANDTTSSETVGEDKARKANGTDTSGSTSEEEKMSKAAEGSVTKGIRPIIFKDAEGKEFIQAVAPNGLVQKYTPGAKIPEGHTTMTEEWEQNGSNGNFGNENGQGKGKAAASESADDELNHTGAGGLKKSELETVIKSLATLPDLVSTLAKTIETQGEQLKKTGERLDAIEKTATVALAKADKTVVHVGTNYDSAYENLGGGRRPVAKAARTAEQIRKAEYPDELWSNGVLGALETHIPGVESV